MWVKLNIVAAGPVDGFQKSKKYSTEGRANHWDCNLCLFNDLLANDGLRVFLEDPSESHSKSPGGGGGGSF